LGDAALWVKMRAHLAQRLGSTPWAWKQPSCFQFTWVRAPSISTQQQQRCISTIGTDCFLTETVSRRCQMDSLVRPFTVLGNCSPTCHFSNVHMCPAWLHGQNLSASTPEAALQRKKVVCSRRHRHATHVPPVLTFRQMSAGCSDLSSGLWMDIM
jgi:hypothetical protein